MRTVLIALMMLFPTAAPAADPAPLVEWKALGGGPLPQTWTIADGIVRHVPGGGDIRTVAQYGNFELDFDWQISPGGNSGVFYRASDGDALDGPEYQIVDNGGHPDGRTPITSAAGAYAVYPPVRDATRPVDQWNSARIVVEGSHVEHWLNGLKVLSYELGSPDWQARVAASKFRGTAYGRAPQGYIVLQDHGAIVAYRNLTITQLPQGKKERAAHGGPFRSRMVSRGLWRLNCLDRCDDYRGCSIRKRNDPRPTETFDF